MMPYDNNSNRPTVSVYTPISFTNPDSPLSQSRLSINYFNRMMQITIAPRIPPAPNEAYPSYNKDGAVTIFITYTQAKLLHDGFADILSGKSSHHNVCTETKNGLFILSDGVDKGTDPYAAIFYVGKGSGAKSVIYYYFKRNYELPCDYSENKYDTIKFPDFEVSTLLMVLESYYNAASYAIAATVAESNMYRQKFTSDALKSIAGKVGAALPNAGGSNGGGYSFLNNSQSSSSPVGFDPTTALTGGTGGVAKADSVPTFDDMINSSMSTFDD